jgi:hypothetical protein
MTMKIDPRDGVTYDDSPLKRYMDAGNTLCFDRIHHKYYNKARLIDAGVAAGDIAPRGSTYDALIDFVGETFVPVKLTATVGGSGLTPTITFGGGPHNEPGRLKMTCDYTGAPDPVLYEVLFQPGTTTAQLATLCAAMLNAATGAESNATVGGSVVTYTCISPVTAVTLTASVI